MPYQGGWVTSTALNLKPAFEKKIHFNYIYLRPASPVHSLFYRPIFASLFVPRLVWLQLSIVAVTVCGLLLWVRCCTGPATNRNFGTRLPTFSSLPSSLILIYLPPAPPAEGRNTNKVDLNLILPNLNFFLIVSLSHLLSIFDLSHLSTSRIIESDL